MTLTRAIDQWRHMKPDAVVAGGAAQVQYEAYSAWSGLANALKGDGTP